MRTYITDDLDRVRRGLRQMEQIYDYVTMLADPADNLPPKLSKSLDLLIDAMVDLRCDLEAAYLISGEDEQL